MDNYNHIAKWLIPQLRQRKTTIETFAKECGIARATIYAYIDDTIRPNPAKMQRMCEVLNRPLAEGLKQFTPRKPGRPKGISVKSSARPGGNRK